MDARLEPRWDWQKYAGWYRTGGHLMYNPESDPEVCRRPNGQSPERNGKHSMLEVAQWLEGYAADVKQHLTRVGKPNSPEPLRGVVDADMQAGLGHFFAAKFRAGVLYAVYEHTGDRRALAEALKAYRSARTYRFEVEDLAR